MKVYAVTLQRPWDGKEIISIHMTRKAALQVACEEMLETMVSFDTYDDSDLVWIEDNLSTLHNPNHTLTIKQLDDMFLYAEKLLWEIENEVEILHYTLQP